LGEFSPKFAQCLIANFGKWFENYKSSAHLWGTFSHGTSYVLILTKNGLGYILGDFFTNSSGHPDHALDLLWKEPFQIFFNLQFSGQEVKCFSLSRDQSKKRLSKN
jgi:hypothetical protein